MVPAYLEQLPIIPMTISNKADHKKLPAPKGPRFSRRRRNEFVAPRTETETILAGALAEVLKVERVSVAGQLLPGPGRAFAADGALLRQDPAAPGPVGRLDAGHLPQPDDREARRPSGARRSTRAPVPTKQLPFRIPSDLEYYGCGALQLLFYAGYGLVRSLAAQRRGRAGPMRRSTVRPSSICAAWLLAVGVLRRS